MSYEEQVEFVMVNAWFDPVNRKVHFNGDEAFLAEMSEITDKALDDALLRIKRRDAPLAN